MIVGTAVEQWGLKKSERPIFEAKVEGIVVTYFHFKQGMNE